MIVDLLKITFTLFFKHFFKNPTKKNRNWLQGSGHVPTLSLW